MQKYSNIPCYLWQGHIYSQLFVHGAVAKSSTYQNESGQILYDSDRLNALFFSSILECQTWRILQTWVADFKLKFPQHPIQLIQQLQLVIIPKSKCFGEYKHKVDFALVVNWDSQEQQTIYCIEAKGSITRESLVILRLIEYFYKGLSQKRYLMVFSRLPKKFPREFPIDMPIVLAKELRSKLDLFISENNQ